MGFRGGRLSLFEAALREQIVAELRVHFPGLGCELGPMAAFGMVDHLQGHRRAHVLLALVVAARLGLDVLAGSIEVFDFRGQTFVFHDREFEFAVGRGLSRFGGEREFLIVARFARELPGVPLPIGLRREIVLREGQAHEALVGRVARDAPHFSEGRQIDVHLRGAQNQNLRVLHIRGSGELGQALLALDVHLHADFLLGLPGLLIDDLVLEVLGFRHVQGPVHFSERCIPRGIGVRAAHTHESDGKDCTNGKPTSE